MKVKRRNEQIIAAGLTHQGCGLPTCDARRIEKSGCRHRGQGSSATGQCGGRIGHAHLVTVPDCNPGIGRHFHPVQVFVSGPSANLCAGTSASVLGRPSSDDGACRFGRNFYKGSGRFSAGGIVRLLLARARCHILGTVRAIACGNRLLVPVQGANRC